MSGGNAISAHPRGWMFGDNFGKWVAFVGTYCTTSALLTAFILLKFENGVYEKHGWFVIISIVALVTTISTSWIKFYTNNNLQSFMNDHFSPLYNMTMNSVFLFSAIISQLALVMIVIIPHESNWVGFAIMGALFVIIFGLGFKVPIKPPGREHTDKTGGHRTNHT